MRRWVIRCVVVAILAIGAGIASVVMRHPHGTRSDETIIIGGDISATLLVAKYDVGDLLEVFRPAIIASGLYKSPKEVLLQLVTDAVDPASWSSSNGGIADARFLSNRLFVVQTPRNHRLIEAVLADLRKAFVGPHAARTLPNALAMQPTQASVINRPELSASRPNGASRKLFLRVYDVRDILSDHMAYCHLYGRAQLRKSAASEENADAIKSLSRLIADAVETDAWKDNGGWIPEPIVLNNQMIVIGDDEVHRQVTMFFVALRHPARVSEPDDELSGWIVPDTGATSLKLSQCIPKLRFDRVRLKSATDALANATGLDVLVDRETLAYAGIDPNALVTLHLWNVPAHAAIEVLLREVSPKLEYAISDGIVVITTRESAMSMANFRIYDVRPVIERAIAFHHRNSSPFQPGTIYPGWSANSIHGDEYEADETADRVTAKMKVILEQAIDSDSWKNTLRMDGRFSAMSGRLIVNQTPENHRRIEQALFALRDGSGLEGETRDCPRSGTK